MGTVVLLPQDCLPSSRSRHKHHILDMIYRSESAPRARRNTLQASVLKNAPSSLYPDQKFNSRRTVDRSGLLPLPDHGLHPLPFNIPRKGAIGKKSKARKPAEQWATNAFAKPDVPVFTILQRPKHKEAVDELIAKFLLKVDGAKAPNGDVDMKVDGYEPRTESQNEVLGLKVDGPKLQAGSQNSVLGTKVDGSRSKNGAFDMKVDGSKFQRGVLDLKVDVSKPQNAVLDMKVNRSKPQMGVFDMKVDGCKSVNMKMGASKLINVVKKKGQSRSDDLVHLKALHRSPTLKVTEEREILKTDGKVEDVSCKVVIVNQPARTDSMLFGGLARLRRASTDPQMVKHLLDQCRSEVMEVAFSEANLGSHAFGHGLTKSTASMSCHERWAGPAYSSSPAPSSLPLPKFSLPSSRMSSLEFSPLVVEQYTKDVYMQPSALGSSVPTFPAPVQGGAWDVAFATKSLRRMLNLDPC